jgi:hydrogenase large subunit
MRRIELIEKIEGEAYLSYDVKDGVVSTARVEFPTSRYIEEILRGRAVEDALVINPRVCGICGHSHLIATVKAIENSYKEPIRLSRKAQIIRELTLNFEIMQNHFKWFYLTIAPLLGLNFGIERAIEPSRVLSQMIAILAGQYPHNSYAVVGGVTSAPTPVELLKLKELLKRVESMFQKYIVTSDIEALTECDKIETLLKIGGDLPKAMRVILENGWESLGKSHDRFILFGDNLQTQQGKMVSTRLTRHLDYRYITEVAVPNSKAKNLLYRGKFYETGPLARAMLIKTPLIKEAHRRFKDSIFSRILARVCEIARILQISYELIEQIDLLEESFIQPPPLERYGVGIGMVEASRGSLIHRVEFRDGKILDYTIITPTQWNLGSSQTETPSVVQKALIGALADSPLELIFKSFDVCSVCTTH